MTTCNIAALAKFHFMNARAKEIRQETRFPMARCIELAAEEWGA